MNQQDGGGSNEDAASEQAVRMQLATHFMPE
jgi:hypothetical protein